MSPVTAATPWREIGDVSLAVYQHEFRRRSSPMLAEATTVRAAVAGLSALALAMWAHETEYGNTGQCSRHRNPGCVKRYPPSPPYDDPWRDYPTWTDAARDWVLLMTGPDSPFRGTTTLAEMIAIYAPSWDGNNEERYVQFIGEYVARYRQLDTELSGGAMAQPTIHDIQTDHARYGLTAGERNVLLSKRIPNRDGRRPSFVVLHVQEGSTVGSLRHWLGVSASATVMANFDGSLLRVIPEQHGPWTNGDIQAPNATGRRAIDAGGGDPNRVSLTIEAEGTSNGNHPPAQIDAIVWQCRDWMGRYGISVENVIRHRDINSVSRAHCPGPYAARVIAALQTAPAPPARTFPWPGDLTDADAAALFGTVAPADFTRGVLSRSWAERFVASGKAPALVEIMNRDGYRLFRFGDGSAYRIATGQPRGAWLDEGTTPV